MNYLALLESGIENWNQWRAENPDEICDLSQQDLSEGYFIQGNFSNVNFTGAQLQRACFIGANLQGANLSQADLSGAYMGEADLREANLSDASLTETNLNRADLRGAQLSGTKIAEAHTYKAHFSEGIVAGDRSDETDPSLRYDTSKGTVSKRTVSKGTVSKGTVSERTVSKGTVSEHTVTAETPPSAAPAKMPSVATLHQASRTVPKRQPISRDVEVASNSKKSLLVWLPVMAATVASLLVLSIWVLENGPSGKDAKLNAANSQGERISGVSSTGLSEGSGTSKDATAPFKLMRSIDSDSQIWALATYTPSARNPDLEPMVAGGGDDGKITLWNPQTGAAIRTLTGHNIVRTLAISESGQWLVSGGRDGIRVWHPDTGERIYTIDSTGSPIESVAISPNGRIFISADDSGKITVWHIETGEPLYSVQNDSSVLAVVIAPDGQSFISGNRNGTIQHRDLVSGKQIQTWNGHDDGVRSIAISADGTTFATGSWDSTIKLWALDTGELKATFTKQKGGHDGQVMSVAFSPDGTTLASGGTDNQLKRWDLSRQELIETVGNNDDWVLSVAFASVAQASADADEAAGAARSQLTLISSGKDKTVKKWQPAP